MIRWSCVLAVVMALSLPFAEGYVNAAESTKSRYGDPNEVLAEDWVPHLPGINAPGKYEDYAKDPWKTFTEVMRKVNAGAYEYFYPKKK